MEKYTIKADLILKNLKTVGPVYWVILFLVLLTSVGFWYSNLKTTEYISELTDNIFELTLKTDGQQRQITLLVSGLASSTTLFVQSIEETESNLTSALEEEKKSLEVKLGKVESQVGQVSGTVDTLEKLSKTDPELLQKYSKVFFLNEHYIPPRLVDIQNKHKYSERKDLEIHFEVKPHLEDMLDSALQNGVEVYVSSAYRSFESQENLKGQYTIVYGDGANTFSADQGYSEHQLGTTLDLITTGIGGTLSGFDGTLAYLWLTNNAFKYGFVLSYPQNNSFYIFEPWHWRFVGVELATYLRGSGKNFYDLDQREIDEYLVNIFD